MILVMWSGGLDSTATLLKALKETNQPVWAHFIQLENFENRHINESKAVERLLPKLQNIKAFKFTTNTITWPATFACPFDIFSTYFVASQICQYYPVKEFWNGILIRPDVGAPGLEERIKKATILFNSCTDAKIVYPFKGVAKSEIIKYIGSLFDDTWSCRRPVDIITKCGKCHACKEIQQAKEEL